MELETFFFFFGLEVEFKLSFFYAHEDLKELETVKRLNLFIFF